MRHKPHEIGYFSNMRKSMRARGITPPFKSQGHKYYTFYSIFTYAMFYGGVSFTEKPRQRGAKAVDNSFVRKHTGPVGLRLYYIDGRGARCLSE